MKHITIYRKGFEKRAMREALKLLAALRDHFSVKVEVRPFQAGPSDPSLEQTFAILDELIWPIGVSDDRLHSMLHENTSIFPPHRMFNKDEVRSLQESSPCSMTYNLNIIDVPEDIDEIRYGYLSLVDTWIIRERYLRNIGFRMYWDIDHVHECVLQRFPNYKSIHFDEFERTIEDLPFMKDSVAYIDGGGHFIMTMPISRVGKVLAAMPPCQEREIFDITMSWVMFTHHEIEDSVDLYY